MLADHSAARAIRAWDKNAREQLSQYQSFEAASVGLNKVRTRSIATTSDAADFVAAVTVIHP